MMASVVAVDMVDGAAMCPKSWAGSVVVVAVVVAMVVDEPTGAADVPVMWTEMQPTTRIRFLIEENMVEKMLYVCGSYFSVVQLR